MKLGFILFIIFIPIGLLANERALFSAFELKQLAEYKSDQAMIQRQLDEWRKQDSFFFQNVLEKTSQEDMLALRASWPKIVDDMDAQDHEDKMDEWLKELSRDKTYE